MAKAAYAKNFRSVRAFCVLIKKERMRRDAVSFPFIFMLSGCVPLSSGLCGSVTGVENLLLKNLVTFNGMNVCHVAGVLVVLGVVVEWGTK